MIHPAEMAVTVKSLQALTSGGRMQVLRCLRQRRMTAAEVSTALNIHKSSAHKHLSRLSDAGFVTRHDDDRVWVYYSLTPHGRHLISSERPRFALLLAASVVIVVGAASVIAWRVWEYANLMKEAWQIDHISGPPPPPEFFTPTAAAATVVLVLALAAASIAAWRLRRNRRAYG